MKKLTRKLGVVFCALVLVVSGFSGIAMDKADAATKYAKAVTVTVNGKTISGGGTYDLHVGKKTTPKVYLKTSVSVYGNASKVATAKVVSGGAYAGLTKVATNKYKVTPKKAGKAKVKITSAAKNKSGKYIVKYIYLRVSKPGFKCTTSESNVMTNQTKTFKLSKSASYKTVTAKVTKADGSKATGVTVTKVTLGEWKVKASEAGRYKITFTGTTCHNKATSTATGYVTVLPRTTTFGPASSKTVKAGADIKNIKIKKADGTDGTKAFFSTTLSKIVKANADSFGADTAIKVGGDTYDIIYKNGKLTYKKNGVKKDPNPEDLAAIVIKKGDSLTNTNYKKMNLGLASLRNGGAYTSAKYTISAVINGVKCTASDAYYKDGYVYFTSNSGKTQYKAYFNNSAELKVVWVGGTPQDFSKAALAKGFAGVLK